MLVYLLLVTSVLFELLLTMLQPRSKIMLLFYGYSAVFLAMFSTSALFIDKVSIFSFLLMVVTTFRVMNIGRVLEPRMHTREIMRRTLRTATMLGLFSMLMLLFYIVQPTDIAYVPSFEILAGVQALVGLVLLLSVLLSRHIYRYRPATDASKEKLPTVSVCIPARNETAELASCIESVLASSYHKLEILVLDDCSHDKTPQIIKEYAHDGVRFIKGKEPSDTWLAKNAVYDKLADEAKGDVLLFIGVDVRLEPHSITELVGQLSGNDMLSVLPLRSNNREGSFFIQPLRYWWELGLLRFLQNHPPVLSTCWLIRSDFLEASGGFEGYKKAIKPEAGLAKDAHNSQKYAFLIANNAVGVTSVKAPKEQYQTALRVRYPQVRRRPESVFFLILLEALFIAGPAALVIVGVLQEQTLLITLATLATVFLMLANAAVYRLVLHNTWIIGLITVPVLVLIDWYVLCKSLYGYEFGRIEWKDRNICLPLLKVEKELPKL